MEDYRGEWEEFIERLAEELAPLLVPSLVREISQRLAPQLRRQLRDDHFKRFRSLSDLSEKLVYRHLMETQPDTFTGIRRPLDMDKKTLSRSLKSLMSKGFVVLDDLYQYWVTEPAEPGPRLEGERRTPPEDVKKGRLIYRP